MDIDEAEKILREKISHITRDYTPEDQALDVLSKHARATGVLIKALMIACYVIADDPKWDDKAELQVRAEQMAVSFTNAAIDP